MQKVIQILYFLVFVIASLFVFAPKISAQYCAGDWVDCWCAGGQDPPGSGNCLRWECTCSTGGGQSGLNNEEVYFDIGEWQGLLQPETILE